MYLKKAENIVHILSDSVFCAEMLCSHLSSCKGLIISGICSNNEELNRLLKILKIDIVVAISNNLEFFKKNQLHNINKPTLIIGPDQGLNYFIDKKGMSLGSEFQFISINSKLQTLEEKIKLLVDAKPPLSIPKDYGFITKREKEILQLILKGKKNKDIAEELFLSIKTVENHRNNILKKTNYNSIIQLINELYKIGFLS